MARTIPLACFAALAPRAADAQSPPPPPPKSGSSGGGSSLPPPPNRRNRDDDTLPTVDPHAVLKAYEKDIKRDVAKLLEMAGGLKKDAEQLGASQSPTNAMLRKVDDIEKLAHKISSMARG